MGDLLLKFPTNVHSYAHYNIRFTPDAHAALVGHPDPVGEVGIEATSVPGELVHFQLESSIFQNMTTAEDIKLATTEDYLREHGYPSHHGMNEEQFSAFLKNVQFVCNYIIENNLEEENVINSYYTSAVMVFVILEKITIDGYTDELTDAEKFYDFCKTYTERECSIAMGKINPDTDKERVYRECCFAAAKKIEEVLSNDSES